MVYCDLHHGELFPLTSSSQEARDQRLKEITAHCTSVLEICQYLLKPGGNFFIHVPQAIAGKIREDCLTQAHKDAGICFDFYNFCFVLTNDSSRYFTSFNKAVHEIISSYLKSLQSFFTQWQFQTHASGNGDHWA